MPDVPAVSESLPGYEILNWFGVVVPAGTPRGIVSRLNSELAKTLHDSEVVARLLELGAQPIANTPEEFGSFMKSESVKWARVIKEAHIRVE